MKSYIKLYGPPILEAVQKLEEMAIDMPKVCIMSSLIEPVLPGSAFGTEKHEGLGRMTPGGVYDYFSEYGEISLERCDKIVSKSGAKLGEYDFYFEWFREPTLDELKELIGTIDKELKPLQIRYSIVTK